MTCKWRAPLSGGAKELLKVVAELERLGSVRKVYAEVPRHPLRYLNLEVVPSIWADREIARKVVLNQLNFRFGGYQWLITVDLLERPHQPVVLTPRVGRSKAVAASAKVAGKANDEAEEDEVVQGSDAKRLAG